MNAMPRMDWVVKTADESVTSSGSVQSDDHLFISVGVNSRYAVDGLIIYEAHTTGDFMFGWLAPSGATFGWLVDVGDPAGTSTYMAVARQWTTGAGVVTAPGLGAGALLTFPVRGLLTTAGSSGSLQFRWGQGTSHATPTIVRAGSFLRLHKIA
ncbi:hypothetical protein [Herbidospora sp. RD11066]